MNSTVLMLLLLMSITFGTAYIAQVAFADGVLKRLDIGLYWDQECIHPVTSLEIGIVRRGESKSLVFWLKNRSTEKGRISWDSTNFNPSSNGITETWERNVGSSIYIDNWHKKMQKGDLWEIHYTVQVAQDTQAGNYIWDLIVCFRVSHKVTSLSMLCILRVTE